MFKRAMLAVAFLAVAGPQASAQIELLVDPDLTGYLTNPSAADISFDGYQIALDDDKVGKLDPVGWDSLSDRIPLRINELSDGVGPGAFGFGELSPTTLQLAEANLIGAGVLKAGAKFSIGKPFGEGGYWVNFYYKVAGIPTQSAAQKVYIPSIPEPSSWLLAILGGAGLLTFRRSAKLSRLL